MDNICICDQLPHAPASLGVGCLVHLVGHHIATIPHPSFDSRLPQYQKHRLRLKANSLL